MSNQYKIPDYEAEQNKSIKKKKLKSKPKPKNGSDEEEEQDEEQKEEEDEEENNNEGNNYMKKIAQKELKRYTKKKIEKSVFERFGIWLNKASKLNFE